MKAYWSYEPPSDWRAATVLRIQRNLTFFIGARGTPGAALNRVFLTPALLPARWGRRGRDGGSLSLFRIHNWIRLLALAFLQFTMRNVGQLNPNLVQSLIGSDLELDNKLNFEKACMVADPVFQKGFIRIRFSLKKNLGSLKNLAQSVFFKGLVSVIL